MKKCLLRSSGNKCAAECKKIDTKAENTNEKSKNKKKK